jgi:hypothetical protein
MATVVAERDALAAARKQRAFTENFCGDPPPSYSALHGKTGLRWRAKTAQWVSSLLPQFKRITLERLLAEEKFKQASHAKVEM